MSEILTTESIGLAAPVTTKSPVISTLSPNKPVIISKSFKELTGSSVVSNQENIEADAVPANGELKISPTKALTEEEKIELRKKKFGCQTENSKLATRAERFGVAASEATGKDAPVQDKAKLNDRAARFGIVTPEDKKAAKAAVKTVPPVSSEILNKRAARFGAADAPSGESDELKSKRKERFGVVNEDDKKKLRSERFQSKA